MANDMAWHEVRDDDVYALFNPGGECFGVVACTLRAAKRAVEYHILSHGRKVKDFAGGDGIQDMVIDSEGGVYQLIPITREWVVAGIENRKQLNAGNSELVYAMKIVLRLLDIESDSHRFSDNSIDGSLVRQAMEILQRHDN